VQKISAASSQDDGKEQRVAEITAPATTSPTQQQTNVQLSAQQLSSAPHDDTQQTKYRQSRRSSAPKHTEATATLTRKRKVPERMADYQLTSTARSCSKQQSNEVI
jgi:hypothetical protein